ncbi:MAG: hypothetical protein PHF67_04780 [Candidatus Nanoarchaeia archaeon]|nr:hypothetical protein [Candidatus Nanoarchaeia archaeon]
MNTTIVAAGLGCLGGLTRSTIGLFKAHARHDKIKIGFIIRTMRLSAISGTFIGIPFYFNPIISFVAGYVGSDILEGVYASFKRTKIGKKTF